uniref:Uncharacterized protein n=1 Tax=Tetranychus urticae TaxID=32264 RepID=T1L3M3_TETUR
MFNVSQKDKISGDSTIWLLKTIEIVYHHFIKVHQKRYLRHMDIRVDYSLSLKCDNSTG